MSNETPKRTTLSPELRAKMERRGAIERIAGVLAEDAPLETAEDFEMAATDIVDRGLSDLRKALTASPPVGTVGVPNYTEIIAIVNDCVERMRRSGESYPMLSRWISEALRALTVGTEPKTCQRCQGNGEIVTDWDRYRTPHNGDVGDEAVAECPDCDGAGVIQDAGAKDDDPVCTDCGGTGTTYQTERRCACQSATPPQEPSVQKPVASEDLARGIAVAFVDAIHGYTVEFAPSPAAHLEEYNKAESAVAYALDSYLASPSPAGDRSVKALIWEKKPGNNGEFADTVCGRYEVGKVGGAYIAVIRLIKDGQWDDNVFARNICAKRDAKDAAQADFEQRILSVLTSGADQ